MPELNMKKALVVGMAKSGVAAAALLAKLGCDVTVNDAKPKEKLGDALRELEGQPVREALGMKPDELVDGCDAVIVSPGVPLDLPFAAKAKALGIPVLAETELGARFTRCPICAITGTNGKTTTTTLLNEIFAASGARSFATGNIGLPLCAVALETKPEDRMALEASSFMMEAIETFRPRVSAVLNLREDHMNRHKTMENYVNAKARIFENQRDDDVLLLNWDDEPTRALAPRANCRVMYFSTRERVPAGTCVLEGHVCFIPAEGAEPVVMGRPEDIRIPGRHNLENALAAACMAMVMGVDPAVVEKTLTTFEGVEHRIEYVRTVKGVRYINDSKGTNVDSTLAAINAMDRPTVLIAGGSEKNADFAPMIAGFTPFITAMVVLGQTGPRIAQAAKDAGWEPVVAADSFEDALNKAAALAVPGGNVLLSPACASFDMFRDYEHRGEVFKELVRKMGDAQ